jgi:hypothetical protein
MPGLMSEASLNKDETAAGLNELVKKWCRVRACFTCFRLDYRLVFSDRYGLSTLAAKIKSLSVSPLILCVQICSLTLPHDR